MRSVRAAAVTALVAAACSSFGTSAPEPAPAEDAGTSSSSTSSSGSVVPPDGAAPDAASGSGSGYCASVAASTTYCADFDDGTFPGADGWSLVQAGGGQVRLATTGARSGSHAITSAADAGTDVAAALRRAIGPKPTAITMAAGVRIDSVAGGGADVFVLEMTGTTYVYYALEIAVQGDGTAKLQEHRFASGAPDYDIANEWSFTEKVPVGKWFELALVLTMTGGTSTASIQVDGKTVATGAPAAHQLTELTSVMFGTKKADANVSWKVAFDDVRATITP